MNPDAKPFEFNSTAEEFVPSFPTSAYFYQPRPTPTIYPAQYTYDLHPDVLFVFSFPPRFYMWHDGNIYLRDGVGKIFGPFYDDDQTLFYQQYLADKTLIVEEEKKEESDEISFSDFMKKQESRARTQGPKIGYKQVAVVGIDRIIQEQQIIEEEKIIVKTRIEKPKIKLVPEKPIDKLALINKLRENPDTNPENFLKETDDNTVPVNIVFIGHVDAGKSTICGNILLLTGKIDKRTIEVYEQDAKDKGRDS